MKYVAVVTSVVQPGIRKVGGLRNGEFVDVDLPQRRNYLLRDAMKEAI
jgi:hypothetical protein